MAHLEPILERTHCADTFACRVGKGSLVAARRAQQHLRRWPWFVKSDVRRYFDSIDHDWLLERIERRVRGAAVLRLCKRIIRSYSTQPGCGLPIGSLTSQHFANLYLAPFDRWLLEAAGALGMVRYMDDTVWWVRTREQARATLADARVFLAERCRLRFNHPTQIQRSAQGLTLCGFRITQGALQLSRRRRRRYAEGRLQAEAKYARGAIGSAELQSQMAATLAITAHADAVGWRRAQLRVRPPPDA